MLVYRLQFDYFGGRRSNCSDLGRFDSRWRHSVASGTAATSMSASSIFTSMRGHRQSSAAYGRLTVGTKPQRKCHHRINRSIVIADFIT